jgi:monoamine oxidase
VVRDRVEPGPEVTTERRPGAAFLKPEDYLSKDERKKRSRQKQDELDEWRLWPDWLRRQDVWCLPPGRRVAVVGGGFSGLCAAWYLNRLGVDIILYEALNRLGGRVLTNRRFVPNKLVEAGAELIGENHPLWNRLAREFGLTLEELTDDDQYEERKPSLHVRWRFRGVDLDKARKDAMRVELKRVLTIMGREAKPVPQREPWAWPDAGKFDPQTVGSRLNALLPGRNQPGAQRDAHDFLSFLLGNDNCARVGEQGYFALMSSISAARMGSDDKGMLGYFLSTETHRCKGGNDLLAEALFKSLPRRKVRTTTQVTRIEVNFGVIPPVIIESLEEGTLRRREVFDAVILTAPPTVWNAITFAPSFDPDDRTITHGPAIKFFSRYGDRWWEQSPHLLAPNSKWDELGGTWEGTDHQDTPPGFCLVVFSGGQFVMPQARYPTQLAKIYPPPPNSPVLDEMFVDWTTEKHIEAGYAVPAKNQVTTVARKLSEPHGHRLFFAGEQCSMGFYGYMEGALQEGARAARDVVWLFKERCDGSILI